MTKRCADVLGQLKVGSGVSLKIEKWNDPPNDDECTTLIIVGVITGKQWENYQKPPVTNDQVSVEIEKIKA